MHQSVLVLPATGLWSGKRAWMDAYQAFVCLFLAGSNLAPGRRRALKWADLWKAWGEAPKASSWCDPFGAGMRSFIHGPGVSSKEVHRTAQLAAGDLGATNPLSHV